MQIDGRGNKWQRWICALRIEREIHPENWIKKNVHTQRERHTCTHIMAERKSTTIRTDDNPFVKRRTHVDEQWLEWTGHERGREKNTKKNRSYVRNRNKFEMTEHKKKTVMLCVKCEISIQQSGRRWSSHSIRYWKCAANPSMRPLDAKSI